MKRTIPSILLILFFTLFITGCGGGGGGGESGSESNTAVTGVTLNKNNISLLPGNTEQLTAGITPIDAGNQGVVWSSDDASVSTVDQEGNVTGIKVGTATITVTTDDGGFTDTCNVTVSSVNVTGVTLDEENIYLVVGDAEQLKATISPSNAASKNVTWRSENENIATVDQEGNVSAQAAGTTTVTVTTEDGGYTDSCGVTVTTTAVAVTGVALDAHTLSLVVGESGQLAATVSPYNATNQDVTWTSGDETIAAVDQEGNISALAEGTATITVTTSNGGYSDTCEVAVSPVTSLLNKVDVKFHVSGTVVTGNTVTLSIRDESGSTTLSTLTVDADNITEGWNTFEIDGISVTQGVIYRIDIEASSNISVYWLINASNMYIDGISNASSTRDFLFRTYDNDALDQYCEEESTSYSSSYYLGTATRRQEFTPGAEISYASELSSGPVNGTVLTPDITVSTISSSSVTSTLTNSITMAGVTGGAMQLRDRKVNLDSFFIGETELTYKQWYEVYTWAASNGYTFARTGREGSDGTAGAAPTNEEPVTKMTWWDCIVWCNALSAKEGLTPCYTYEYSVIKDATDTDACDAAVLDLTASGYRLPTEAEWEYAARGGTSTNHYSYAGSDTAGDVAWYLDVSGDDTHEVADLDPNEVGTYDMSGNVKEWCWDWDASSVSENGTETNPAGPDSGTQRVIRGGAYNEYSFYSRVSTRSGGTLPITNITTLGFRLVRSN